MKRGALVVALVFSIGINLGLAFRFLTPATPSPLAEVGGESGSAEPVQEPGSFAGTDRPVGSGARPGEGRPFGIRQMADELGLEGEARRAFHELKRDFFERTRDQRRRVAALQTELRAALGEDPPDRSQVADLVDRLGEAHGELEGLFAEHFLATLDLLEPEQRALYRERLLEQLGRGAPNRGAPAFSDERERRREERMRRRGGGPRQRPAGGTTDDPGDGAG